MSLTELLCLGLDAAILTILYKFYRDASTTLRAVKDAPTLEISQNLKSDVGKYAQGCIPYAIIRGSVKAIQQPIISKNVSDVVGVIHESVVREHKIQWSWASRWWREVKADVSRTTNVVPFMLKGDGSDGAFVEILEPMNARGMELRTVFDEFKQSQAGFWDSLSRFFIGETTTGYQYIETMLPEGSTLTGMGALVLQHGRVCLQPPDNGLMYYLTQMSEGSLVRNLEKEVNVLKMLAIVFGAFGGLILTVMVYKFYEKRRLQAERSAELKRMREMIDRQNQRREEMGEGSEEPDENRLCVVCQVNQREVLILECGHLCCCAQCGQMLTPPLCPVCRSEIVRLVPAYVS